MEPNSLMEDTVFAKCDCCGLTEECTPAYIDNIRGRYHGNCLCGLCGEAVNDEVLRSRGLITTEEAMTGHINFCRKSLSPAVHLVDAMRQILWRNKTKGIRLSRSEGCMLTLALESSTTDLQ